MCITTSRPSRATAARSTITRGRKTSANSSRCCGCARLTARWAPTSAAAAARGGCTSTRWPSCGCCCRSACCAPCGRRGRAFAPALLGCAYTVCDVVFDRFVRTRPVPRYRMNYVSEKNCTLTVVTTLLTGADDELFARLERFRIANRGPNLYFGVLGDLPDAKSARLESDARVIEQAKAKIDALNVKYGGGFCLVSARARRKPRR